MKTFQSLIININRNTSFLQREVTTDTLAEIQEVFDEEARKVHPPTIDFKASFDFTLLCLNNFTGVDEVIKFSNIFSGEAASYRMRDFARKLINNIECCYIKPCEVVHAPVATIATRETTTSDQPPFKGAGQDHMSGEDRVDAGRNGTPRRGITKRKRPVYDTLGCKIRDYQYNRSEFITSCVAEYGVCEATAAKWYSMTQAVFYKKIPCYAKWPGNGVMLKHRHNRTKRADMCNLYDISMGTLIIWQELVREVLLKAPDTTIESVV